MKSNQLKFGWITRLMIWLCGFAMVMPSLVLAAVPSSIQLGVGEQQTVVFEEDVRSAIPSDPSVVDLQGVGQRELIIRGNKSGASSVEYVLRSGSRGQIQVRVGHSQLPQIKRWLDGRLRDVIGVETVINANLNVEIVGRVRDGESFDRVKDAEERALKMWPGKVFNSVDFTPDTEFAQKVIKEWLGENGIVEEDVILQGRRLRISGLAYAQEDRDRVERGIPNVVARLRLGDMTIDNAIVVDDSIIEIDMMFFQMNEGVVEELGADLLNNIGLNVQGVASFGEGSPKYSAVVNVELGKVFNMLAEDGKVETLHHTTLSTENNKEATTQFGESMVIVKRGVDRDSVEEIEAGHILRVTPTLQSGGQVRMTLSGEVSEIGAMDRDSNVRVAKNNFQNVMVLPLDRGMVAAFHKGNRWVKVRSGTPFLRHVPLIKLIAGKDRYEDTVVYRGFVVTPRLRHKTIASGPSVADQTDEIIRRLKATADKR